MTDKTRKDRDGLTSLVVEFDENKAERVYWVKHEDLSLDNSKDVETLAVGDLEKTDTRRDEDGEESGNIFNMTTPLKERADVNEPGKAVDEKISNVADLSKGKLGGTLFTDEEGYTYIYHSTSAFRRQLRCTNSNLKRNKCRARASVALGVDDAEIVKSSKCPPHNHQPVDESSLASKFARLLKKRVYSSPRTPIVQLYNEECKKFPEGAGCLPRKIAFQRMQRYRREYALAVSGKVKSTSSSLDDDPSSPSTEVKMLAEGRIIYVDHKGYQYHQQHVTANKRQLRCTKARVRGYVCPARASMDLKPRYSHIKLSKNRHNHPPPDVDCTLFSYNLKLRARNDLDKSLKKIYEEEATKNPEAAAVITFCKIRQSMQRARRTAPGHTSQNVDLTFDSVFDAEEIQDEGSAESSPSKSDTELESPTPTASLDPKTAPIPVVEVVVSAQGGAPLDEMVLDQCIYCRKLFKGHESLEQHILTSHINIIVPENNIWEEPLPK